jgi:hypothetical protein
MPKSQIVSEVRQGIPEIAAILASGFVEMRRVQLRLEKPSGIVSESRGTPLDDTAKTVLPVHGG